jgi:hypothetical protein
MPADSATRHGYEIRFMRMASMVPVARRWVRGMLAACPRARDVELVVSELAGDMLRYGQGTDLTVSLTVEPDRVRVCRQRSRPLR